MAEIEKNKTSPKSTDTTSASNVELSSSGPGDLLVKARKKLKLSIKDVAKQLNLSASVIEQLESDQYTDEIPDAFIRGYLRTYARAVEIDEEEIVAIYTQNIGLEIVRNYYVPSTDVAPVKSQVGSHILWFKILSLAVIITILVLGWMAFKQSDQKPTTASDNLLSPIEQEKEQVQKIAQEEDVALTEEKSTAQDIVDQDSIIQERIEPVSIAQENTGKVVTNSTGSLEQQEVAADAELEFTFLEDCWVKVIDSNDEVLAVGLKSAGRRFSVSGAAPIRVVLGKPRAVSLQFNNELVDLTLYPAGQTARFSLGESPSVISNSRD